MIYHILNGDSLAQSFPTKQLPGEVVVVREALVDGDVSGETLSEFWQTRARVIGVTISGYHNRVASEFEKLQRAPADSEFNLWFEYDLFCQVNLWFTISLLNAVPVSKRIFAVHSSHVNKGDEQFWTGFGRATTDDLNRCYGKRALLGESDVQLAGKMWMAYKEGDRGELRMLASAKSSAFPYLEEVVEAHLDRFPTMERRGRPERVVEDIIRNVSTDFQKVFQEFWKRESIYGFGDLQVRLIYDKVMASR